MTRAWIVLLATGCALPEWPSYVGETGPGGTPSVTALAVGMSDVCAVTSAGEVYCWGQNDHGQLGVDPKSVFSSTRPRKIAGITDAVQVAVGEATICARTKGGAVECWGEGPQGELGDGTLVDRLTPGAATIGGATDLQASGYSMCAVSGGQVLCWGLKNPAGQDNVPTAVSGVTGATSVAVGDVHSCAVASGAVWCWGDPYADELGDGQCAENRTPTPPVQAQATTGASAVAVAYGETCAILGATASCWGQPVGAQTQATCPNSPQPITGPSVVTRIAGGEQFFCALDATGGVWCWGDDVNGDLGDGTTTPNPTPTKVAIEGSVTTLGAGPMGACAYDGKAVWCWGLTGTASTALAKISF